MSEKSAGAGRGSLIVSRCSSRREAVRGQALLWVALLLPVFLSIIGLAIDGGIVFAARRQAQNIADAAARAGAQEIDIQRYRDSGEVALDAGWARYEARRYAAGLGAPDASINVAENQVEVVVRRDVPLSFLRLVGISNIHVEASATAAPYYGIDEGRR